MRREFKGVISFDDNVNSLMDSWPEWCRKLIKLSKLESSSRPLIRKILAKLDENSGDNSKVIIVNLYCILLYCYYLFRCIWCLLLRPIVQIAFSSWNGKNAVFVKHFEVHYLVYIYGINILAISFVCNCSCYMFSL